MHYRQLMLSAVKGEILGKIPFVPRLDIWYKSNKLNGTLPQKYRNTTLFDIVEDLGVGYHAAIPDFRDYPGDDCDVDLGLGIYRFRTIPYETRLHNVKRIVKRFEGGILRVEYITPYGSVTTGIIYDEASRAAGSTLSHTIEYAVKGIGDFKAVGYIFKNIEISPKYDDFIKFRESIGDMGIAVAFASLCASPIHYVQKELMSLETFTYENFDYPDEMLEFAENISSVYNSICSVVSECPADVVLSGANYDSSVMSPAFFEENIVDSLNRQSTVLHQKGKYLLTHTDGENRGLLQSYLRSGFDIADSICPAPMTSLSLREIRKVFDDKITIWGGIPSISLLEESMDDSGFEKFLDDLLYAVSDKKRIILSIADTTPPGAKFERILRIAQKVSEL